MGRIRTIKPELFRHEELYVAEIETKLPLRLSFIGLLTCCDREGRFRWKPRQLKLDILPYDNIDFEDVLNGLVSHGFVIRYEQANEHYAYIPTFKKHQIVNKREMQSALPAPASMCTHVHARGELELERELERELEGNRNTSSATLQSTVSQIFTTIPLVDSTEHPVTEADIQEYTKTYPAVDVKEQLLLIRAWNRDNPKNRKTKKGIARHIGMWLADKQNKARRAYTDSAAQQASTSIRPKCKFPGCKKEEHGRKGVIAFCYEHKKWGLEQ